MNTKNNISDFEDDDLKGLTPKLSKLSKKNPFKADEDYFDLFSSEIKNRITDFEEIKTEAPILSNTSKYNTFEIPANYFDELPTRIQEVVINKTSTTSFLEWLILLVKPNFAIPVLATLCIAFAGINFIEKQGERNTNETEFQISDEQLYSIDESTIIETITSASTVDNEKTIEKNNSIENYLIDNNVEEFSLKSEL